jgi:hypothetical protein
VHKSIAIANAGFNIPPLEKAIVLAVIITQKKLTAFRNKSLVRLQ